MRNLYIEKRSNSKFWPTIMLTMFFAFSVGITLAQTTMTWTGAENDRFNNENNWDPAGSITGNSLIIPLQFDTLGNQLFPTPKLTGADNQSVFEVTVNSDANTSLIGRYVVELDNDDVTLTFTNTKILYGATGMVFNKGHIYMNDQKRLDGTNTWMEINGGFVEMKQYFIMRNGNDMNTGGHVTLSGGKMRLNGGFHDRVNKTRNQWTITGDAILEVVGNYGSDETDIQSGWMSGGDDYNIVRVYDPVTNVTTYSAVSAASFLISNADRQVVIAKKPGVALNMISTPLITNAKSLTWKYRKNGETNYTAFTVNSDSASFAPTFDTQGIYFVICEGIDQTDKVHNSQEVEFFVGSDAIVFDPLFDIQYYRSGEVGAKIGVSFVGTPSSYEWKYSTTPDGPYQSFSTPENSNSFTPKFIETGNKYVVVKAMIGGIEHTSFEMLYVIEDSTTMGKNMYWTGLVSNELTNPSNWTPVASYYKNNLNVNAFDSLSTLPYPVYTHEGNDTIRYLYVASGAKLDLNITDTLNVRSDCYINGELNINSGVFTPDASYFRITSEQGVVTLKGNAVVRCRSFIMSDNKGAGGNIYITENSKFYNDVEMPWRQSADTLESVTYLKDKGIMYYIGDVRNTVQGWIQSGKIACVEEGFEPYVLYDADVNYTFVQARSTTAFAIANDQKTYTTANIPIENAITLTNVDGVNGWEWKWSTNVTGPWNSFEPAVTNESEFNPAFAASGTYYVVAVTSEGLVTSNMKPVVVIDLGITPAEEQFIAVAANGDTLMSVIPSQFTVSAIAWYYRVSGSEDYYETGIADSIYVPNFATKGVYEIFYGVEVQDEYGVQYFLQSSSVKITVGNVGVSEMALGALKLFPNPTSGKFQIEGNFNNDYTIEIMDLTGSVLYKQKFAARSKDAIDFSRKGVYIVKMSDNSMTKIGRLVVK